MSSASAAVRYSATDGIGTIVFNRPEYLNALDLDIAAQFGQAVATLADEPNVRVLVLSGAGRAFMAGGDLALFRDATDKPAAARTLIDTVHETVERLARAPFIVIASLHGPVAGAGLSLALCADLAVAADNSTFNLAYSKIGVPPDCGATWTLPRLVGTRRALEIALLSETISAEQALDLGLVNRVVAAAHLESETMNIATRIATGPTMAYSWIKRLIHQSSSTTFSEQLAAERDAFTSCAATADFSTALKAFFAKQRPAFVGR